MWCLVVVAAALGPVVTATPLSTYKEMETLKELACDLLRCHPVYPMLNLTTDCRYNIAMFGEDLCTVVFKRENLKKNFVFVKALLTCSSDRCSD